jgi:hypothetical protein
VTVADFEPRWRDDLSDRSWRAKWPVAIPSGQFRVEMVIGGNEPSGRQAPYFVNWR